MDANPPIPDAAGPDASGGAGGTRLSGRARLAELRLFAHALRQGWNVPDDVKKQATERVGSILKNAKSTRSVLAAARTLVSMTTATVSSIDCAVRVRASEDFDERLKQLEAWQSGTGTDPAEQRPRINVPDRDRRSDRKARLQGGTADEEIH